MKKKYLVSMCVLCVFIQHACSLVVGSRPRPLDAFDEDMGEWDVPAEDAGEEDVLEEDPPVEDAGREDVREDDPPVEDMGGEDVREDDPWVEDMGGEDVREDDLSAEDMGGEDVLEDDPPAEDAGEEDVQEDDPWVEDMGVEDIREDDPWVEDVMEEEIVVIECTGHPDFTPCVVITDPDRDYDICIDGECRSPGCGDVSCNPPGPHFPLPDTNQRACYNDSGEIECPGTPGEPSCATTPWCGQDWQYGWDTLHNPSERFTVSEPGPPGEPVVLDNLTGLEWQGCPAGQSGSTCAGSYDVKTWGNAIAYCDGLTWAGLDDWHLPDRYELQSIVDYGRISPSIDETAFPGTPNVLFWSISSYAGSPSNAWYVYFLSGNVADIGKDSGNAVRCARFGPRD